MSLVRLLLIPKEIEDGIERGDLIGFRICAEQLLTHLRSVTTVARPNDLHEDDAENGSQNRRAEVVGQRVQAEFTARFRIEHGETYERQNARRSMRERQSEFRTNP